MREHRDFRGVKVSPLLVVAKAVCLAVRRTPEVNAAWDEAAQEIVLKHYVNLGIAAATPRGLMVPNIKDADRLDAGRAGRTPSANCRRRRARARRSRRRCAAARSPSPTSASSASTPARRSSTRASRRSSCIGAIRKQPWVVRQRDRPRWVTTLALSFDHRIVDGEQGSRFLADVASVLEEPGNALLF